MRMLFVVEAAATVAASLGGLRSSVTEKFSYTSGVALSRQWLLLLLLLYHRDALFNEASRRARTSVSSNLSNARRRCVASLPDWVQAHPPSDNAASFQTSSIVSMFVLPALCEIVSFSRRVQRSGRRR